MKPFESFYNTRKNGHLMNSGLCLFKRKLDYSSRWVNIASHDKDKKLAVKNKGKGEEKEESNFLFSLLEKKGHMRKIAPIALGSKGKVTSHL